MSLNHLRVYFGPNEEAATSTTTPSVNGSQTVTVQLEEILGSLVDALKSNRRWLKDFATEEVTISTDLHEVIVAYKEFRRSA